MEVGREKAAIGQRLRNLALFLLQSIDEFGQGVELALLLVAELAAVGWRG